MTLARKRQLLDKLEGAIAGALITGAVTFFSLFGEIKEIKFRLAQLESTVSSITKVEVRTETIGVR